MASETFRSGPAARYTFALCVAKCLTVSFPLLYQSSGIDP